MTQPGIRAAVAVAAASFVIAGCAAGIAANKRSPGLVENGTFKPARPPNPNYGPDPALTCPERGVNAAVQDLLNERFKGKAVPQLEGRLCAVADTLLGWPGGADEPPSEAVRAFLSQYFGLPDTVRRFVITTMETEKPDDIAPGVSESIASFAATAQNPRYGMITQRLKKSQTKIVVVMQDMSVELDPVPRKLAPGSSALIKGKVLGLLDKPKVQVVDPVGKLESSPEGTGKEFKAQIKCADKPGKILVQLVGEADGSDLLLASFPVYCAAEPPVAVRVPATGKDAAPADPGQAEQKLVDLINADRTTAGLKPLEADPGLASIARGISENRTKGKGVTGAELQARLKEKDIAAPVVLESAVQVVGGAEEVFERLGQSPTDRSHAMSPDMTQIGVGVVKGAEVSGQPPTLIATVLYVMQLPPIDTKDIKAKLYQSIARRRADARTNPVAKDPVLEGIAQKYAEALAEGRGNIPKDKESAIVAPLYKSYGSANILGGTKQDPQEFAEEPGVAGNARLVGLGVAQGNSPQFGKNSAYVVVILGSHQDGKGAPAKKGKKK